MQSILLLQFYISLVWLILNAKTCSRWEISNFRAPFVAERHQQPNLPVAQLRKKDHVGHFDPGKYFARSLIVLCYFNI